MQEKTRENDKLYLDSTGFGWKRITVDRNTLFKAAISGELPIYLSIDNSDHDLLRRVPGENQYTPLEHDWVELRIFNKDVQEIVERPFVRTLHLAGTIYPSVNELEEHSIYVIKTPENWAVNFGDTNLQSTKEFPINNEIWSIFSLFDSTVEPDKEFILTSGSLFARFEDVMTVFPDSAKQYLEDKPYIGRDEIMGAFKTFGREVKSWTTIRNFEERDGLTVIRKVNSSPTLMRSEVLRFLDRKP